jgi:hypothetical protein
MKLNTRSPEYWWADRTYTMFNKYFLDENNHIVNRKTNKQLKYTQNKQGYYLCPIMDDDGKRRSIRITRMIASTFHGKPPTIEHTADHINRNRIDDRIENIRWTTSSEQSYNQDRLETRKSAFIIVRDGLEKTAKEWFEYLKNDRNSFDCEYTTSMIQHYAQRKQHGFMYKEYPDLPDEIWKEIENSKTTRGHWQISNMNRVKYVTKYAENVFYGERLGLRNGYPFIVLGLCHVLSYKAFFPMKYMAKDPNEFVLHEDDDRTDFRPHKLRLGTMSENMIDAHDNGCYNEGKTARMPCCSYINGVFEKQHESQEDAVKYLKSVDHIKYKKTTQGKISLALSGNRNTAYGRTWSHTKI